MYPKTEMRVMSDADILIRTEQYDKIRPIMVELGYSKGRGNAFENLFQVYSSCPPRVAEISVSTNNIESKG